MSVLKQLFIASAGCVMLAAVPAGLSTFGAGSRSPPAQDVIAVNHASQPVPVRNTDNF